MKNFILVLLVIPFLSTAQKKPSFQKTIGGHGEEIIYSMTNTDDGNIIVAGYTASFGNGREVFISKMGPNGDMIWAKTYGGKKTDLAYSIKNTTDGGYIVTGQTSGFEVEKIDALLLKLDANGNIMWTKTYGGELVDIGWDVTQTSDGGYLMVGETNSFKAKDHDLFALKLDSKGTIEWSNLYGADSLEYGTKVIETSQGYLIGGESNSYDTTKWDVWLLHIDMTGEVIWSKTYGGAEEDNYDDLIQDSDSTFVFVGSTESFGYKGRDILFVKINLAGEPLIVRTYGGERSEEPKSVVKVKDDGYVISGFSNSFNEDLTDEDVYVIRIAENGFLKYSKTFGNKNQDFAWAMTYIDGMIYTGGHTLSFGEVTGDHYMYLLGFPDKRTIQTCELTNVQTKTIPHDLIRKPLQVKGALSFVNPVTFTAKEIKITTQNPELIINNICTEGKYTQKEFDEVYKGDKSSNGGGAIIFD